MSNGPRSKPTESNLNLWKDTRAEAKVKAAAKLATTTRQILWAAAHKSRKEAIELGNPRYTGHPCRHPGHGAERYTVCGGCVECARVGAERRRRGAGPRCEGRYRRLVTNAALSGERRLVLGGKRNVGVRDRPHSEAAQRASNDVSIKKSHNLKFLFARKRSELFVMLLFVL